MTDKFELSLLIRKKKNPPRPEMVKAFRQYTDRYFAPTVFTATVRRLTVYSRKY